MPKEETVREFRRFLLVGMLLVEGAVVAYCQSRSPTKSNQPALTGSIAGRVFAVTNSGDIKPARFAKVYVIGGKGNKDNKTALLAYLERRNELLSGQIEQLQVNCEADLLNVTKSVEAAVEWGEDNKISSAVQGTKTDEEGNFHIPGIRLDSTTGDSAQAVNPRTGATSVAWEWSYKIVVLGRAGANDAYWESDVRFNEVNGRMYWRVEAEALRQGKDILMKMPSPEKACLRLGD